MHCPICQHTAILFDAGTVSAQQFFSAPNTYSIAAGGGKERLPLYVCMHCHHGFTPLDFNSTFIDQWYSKSKPDTTFFAGQKARRITARCILNRIETYAPTHGTLLDIGSGPGIFVVEASTRNWNAIGLESASWAIEYGRSKYGITLEQGNVSNVKYMKHESFDVVTLFDVIEHIADPSELVVSIARVLKPKGLLVLTTPRFDSLLARLMGRYWYCIFPAHLHYFTNRSLRQVLHSAGFTIVRRQTHTRYLHLGYVLQRLIRFITGTQKNTDAIATHSPIIPVNFG